MALSLAENKGFYALKLAAEDDDDVQSYSSFSKCKFVYTDKQLQAVRQRCLKRPAVLKQNLNASLTDCKKPPKKA
jgi:hypothetical protein